MTPTQRRACAGYLSETYRVSERRAGRVMGRARSTLRYAARDRAAEQPLVREIRRLARRHKRWGYRRIHAVLERDGWAVNLKRVLRLWRELGLKRPVRHRKARKLGGKPGCSANSCARAPALFRDDVWCYDFVADRTSDGGRLKWQTLVDEHTRESLALHAGRSASGADVRRALGRVIGRRGAPRRIRSDNGSEFVCEALAGWLPARGTQPTAVAPGSPWENGYSGSFKSRFRDEFLEAEEFESVADARQKAAWFRREYNTVRPHSSPGYKAPRQFRDECGRRLHGRPGGVEGISDPK